VPAKLTLQIYCNFGLVIFSPPSAHAFPCPTCGITFSEIRDLNHHVQTRHTNVSPEIVDLNKLQSDMKGYMNYIIEQNQQMMEELCEVKKTMHQCFDNLVDEQERRSDEFKSMLVSKKVADDKAEAKEEESQKVIAKGFDALMSGMRVLESHQVHLSQQICDHVKNVIL
jgi:hypothetical protein